LEVDEMSNMDLLILAVPHHSCLDAPLIRILRDGGAIIDIRSALNPDKIPKNLRYWSL
jgi:UDP-N-acetyl-D-galactosamine dehydrogenase